MPATPLIASIEFDPKELIRSIEITDEEILDDLLYPDDHRALR